MFSQEGYEKAIHRVAAGVGGLATVMYYPPGQAPNVDKQNGIHYGVLQQGDLGEWAFEEFMNNGIDVNFESAITDIKERVEAAVEDATGVDGFSVEQAKKDVGKIISEYCGDPAADDCVDRIEDEYNSMEAWLAVRDWLDEEYGQYYEDCDGADYLLVEYTDGTYWDGKSPYRENDVRFKASWSDTDVWVLKSEWVRVSAQCSPCAPNAGYLTGAAVSNSMGGTIPTYCLDPNDDTWWTDACTCPYKDEAIPLEKYLKLAVETACERE